MDIIRDFLEGEKTILFHGKYPVYSKTCPFRDICLKHSFGCFGNKKIIDDCSGCWYFEMERLKGIGDKK